MIEIVNEKDGEDALIIELNVSGFPHVLAAESIAILRNVREVIAKELGDSKSREIMGYAFSQSLLDEEIANKVVNEMNEVEK